MDALGDPGWGPYSGCIEKGQDEKVVWARGASYLRRKEGPGTRSLEALEEGEHGALSRLLSHQFADLPGAQGWTRGRP